jgi:DNA-directed RNA polymerase specialized sigma subunit
MICRLLARAQQGDDEAMLELINRFQPLLKKYAKKLRYDDAYEDCLLFFIELVKTMD